MSIPVLDCCPTCKGPAKVIPAVKRGLFVATCVFATECPEAPITEPFPSEADASDAWNGRDFAADPIAAIARAL